jgi:hypothetical protein
MQILPKDMTLQIGYDKEMFQLLHGQGVACREAIRKHGETGAIVAKARYERMCIIEKCFVEPMLHPVTDQLVSDQADANHQKRNR